MEIQIKTLENKVDYKIFLDFSKKTKIGDFIFKNKIYDENEYCGGICDITKYVNINFLPRIGESFIVDDGFYGDDFLLMELYNKGGIYTDIEKYEVKDVEHLLTEEINGNNTHYINIMLCLAKENEDKI